MYSLLNLFFIVTVLIVGMASGVATGAETVTGEMNMAYPDGTSPYSDVQCGMISNAVAPPAPGDVSGEGAATDGGETATKSQ